MAFLVQMRQSNKCRGVRNNKIINSHLRSGSAPWLSIPCLLKDTSHIYRFHPPKKSATKKTKNPEMRSNFQQIVLYCFGLPIQNPGLRRVDLEPSPERGSDKINMLKRGANTKKKVDLEPSARRGTNRFRALVSLYWSSQSLHLKQYPNQIPHKLTNVDPIRLSGTWKKSDQIPKSYALQHIKTIFLKTTKLTNAYYWGYKWVCHIQNKTKSNQLAREYLLSSKLATYTLNFGSNKYNHLPFLSSLW